MDNIVINNENEKHIKDVYTKKAINLLNFCIFISFLSIITYLIPLFIYKIFDFGLIFEIISLVFIFIAKNRLEHDDLTNSKKSVIISLISIIWIIIYDFINLIVNILEVSIEVFVYYLTPARFFYYIAPYLFDVYLVALAILLYKVIKSINKANKSDISNSYIDNFYDKL